MDSSIAAVRLSELILQVHHKDVPARTFSEFVSYATANPGQLNYVSGTATAIVATAQLAKASKLDIVCCRRPKTDPLLEVMPTQN
jgi:tripartite-type tricarboxylate transporter receptor subunit TctC